MSQQDKEKWNKKFSEHEEFLSHRPVAEFVERYYHQCGGKRVLDLACGAGRHTLFLSKRGYRVDAVDISDVALNYVASKANDNTTLIEEDLDTYMPKKEHYDLIIMTNFLDRSLIERAKEALKEGGIFVVETYMEDEKNEKEGYNPDFLLQDAELKDIFSQGYELLAYETFWNESYEKRRMKKQAIAVRKI
jgi:SAM-dependent methyltransferase